MSPKKNPKSEADRDDEEAQQAKSKAQRRHDDDGDATQDDDDAVPASDAENADDDAADASDAENGDADGDADDDDEEAIKKAKKKQKAAAAAAAKKKKTKPNAKPAKPTKPKTKDNDDEKKKKKPAAAAAAAAAAVAAASGKKKKSAIDDDDKHDAIMEVQKALKARCARSVPLHVCRVFTANVSPSEVGGGGSGNGEKKSSSRRKAKPPTFLTVFAPPFMHTKDGFFDVTTQGYVAAVELAYLIHGRGNDGEVKTTETLGNVFLGGLPKCRALSPKAEMRSNARRYADMVWDAVVKCEGGKEFRVKMVKLETALLMLEDSEVVTRTVKPMLETIYDVASFWDKMKLFAAENLSQMDAEDRAKHDIGGVTLSLFNAALQKPDCGIDNARVTLDLNLVRLANGSLCRQVSDFDSPHVDVNVFLGKVPEDADSRLDYLYPSLMNAEASAVAESDSSKPMEDDAATADDAKQKTQQAKPKSKPAQKSKDDKDGGGDDDDKSKQKKEKQQNDSNNKPKSGNVRGVASKPKPTDKAVDKKGDKAADKNGGKPKGSTTTATVTGSVNGETKNAKTTGKASDDKAAESGTVDSNKKKPAAAAAAVAAAAPVKSSDSASGAKRKREAGDDTTADAKSDKSKAKDKAKSQDKDKEQDEPKSDEPKAKKPKTGVDKKEKGAAVDSSSDVRGMPKKPSAQAAGASDDVVKTKSLAEVGDVVRKAAAVTAAADSTAVAASVSADADNNNNTASPIVANGDDAQPQEFELV